MTPFDASRLAIRYKNIWRGGPTTEELRHHLANLDAHRADQVLTTLAQTLEHPPTIAHIQRTYHHATPTYGWQQPEDTGEPISLNDYLTRHPEDGHLFTRI